MIGFHQNSARLFISHTKVKQICKFKRPNAILFDEIHKHLYLFNINLMKVEQSRMEWE